MGTVAPLLHAPRPHAAGIPSECLNVCVNTLKSHSLIPAGSCRSWEASRESGKLGLGCRQPGTERVDRQ